MIGSMPAQSNAVAASAILAALWVATAGAAERAKVLNVYAWAEYFPPPSSQNSRLKREFTSITHARLA